MAIRQLRAENFKSFAELDIELNNLTVLVGANASGKSNFISLLRFVRDVAGFGVQNAVSMHGGPEYLTNLANPTADVVVEFTADLEFSFPLSRLARTTWGSAEQVVYQLRLTPARRRGDLVVAGESIAIHGVIGDAPQPTDQRSLFSGETVDSIDRFVIVFGTLDGELMFDSHLPAGLQVDWEIFYPPVGRRSIHRTLLEEDSYHYYPLLRPVQQFLKNIRVYDIDPKAPKRASPITGRSELEENGSNLAVAIQRIIRTSSNRRKFVNLTRDILPFIQGFSVDRLADKSVLAQLQEKFVSKFSLPASFISDGTVAITALVVALYFENQPLIVVEEPERNIHPYLISRLVGMLDDASRYKQIVVTTHNPQVSRHLDPRAILLLSRTKEGYSHVRRPSEIEAVKQFLAADLGLDDLFIQNLLDL